MGNQGSNSNINTMSYGEYQKKWDKKNRQMNSNVKLAQGLAVADTYLTQQYLDFFSSGKVAIPGDKIKDSSKLRIFQIGKMVYDPSEQINDKFISVFSSLHSLKSAVAIIVHSSVKHIYFYAATRAEDNPALAGETLRSVLRGNFPGIDISETFDSKKKEQILARLSSPEFGEAKSLATVSLIPSERDEDKDRFIQGMEKFFDTMGGKVFNAIFLASPVDNNGLTVRKRGYEELYSNLSPYAKFSMSFAHSETDSVNESITSSISNSINNSVSNSNGTSSNTTKGVNSGTNSNYGYSGDGWNFGGGSSFGTSSAFTSGTTFTNTVSESTGKAKTEAIANGKTISVGDTDTMSLNFENKTVSQLLERSQMQLKRISDSEAYGMWDFCAYFFADDISVTTQAANVYKALMMGQESSVECAHVNLWNLTQKEKIRAIVESIKYLVHPLALIPGVEQYKEQFVTPTNMVNGKELPMVLGFPRKSVQGFAVVEMAEFGRTVVFENLARVKRRMEFGNIYHMGVTEASRVPMDVDLLASHCFITGSSGSGKSYATYQLLDSLLKHGIKMMVIEPAKGEYKQVFGGLPGIRIFTTDPNVYKMLQINPFQFPENLHVLTHIEKLIQIFNASWALYAAMPAILKDAVVQSYTKCGWDVMNSIWIEGISKRKYPVFQDVLDILPEIINKSDYSADSKGDYKGALLTRVQSMTSGITGLIFEKSEGIPDTVLFDSNAVVDLSDIGSDETIALLMGVLIMRLGEYRQSVRKAGGDSGRDQQLKHVTVLEEAHNILKRTSKDQSQEGANIVGKSVEMISNSIKEMRTYGEGFIIIDQSPMAVDTSAIENTSTKIIMNTPAKDACDELSSALSLNEEQSRELSRLTTGVAAVFQKGWLTPVLMKIDMWDNHYEAPVQRADMNEIRRLRGELIMELYRQNQQRNYSIAKFADIVKASTIDKEKKMDFKEIVDRIERILKKGGKLPLAQIYISMANCDGLFKVIDDKDVFSINGIKNREAKSKGWALNHFESILDGSERWMNRFRKAIQQYALIPEQKVVEHVMYQILLMRGGRTMEKMKTNKYGTICLVYTKKIVDALEGLL